MIAGILASAAPVNVQAAPAPIAYPEIRNTDTPTYIGTTNHMSFIGMDALSVIGDRLFVAIAADNGASISTPAGWTELSNNFTSGAVRLKIVWKDKSLSEETATFTTGSSVRTTLVGWAVKAGTFSGSPDVSGSGSFSSTTSNDLPSVTNSGGAVPALVVGVIGADAGPTISAYPLPLNNVSLVVGSSLTTAICAQVTGLSSYDPGAFTLSGAVASIGRTVLQRGV